MLYLHLVECPLPVYVSPVLCAHIYSTQIQLNSHWRWSHSHLPGWRVCKSSNKGVELTTLPVHAKSLWKSNGYCWKSKTWPISQSGCAVAVQPKRDGILKYYPEPLQKIHVWSYKVCIPVQPHHKLQPVKWPQSKVNFSLWQSQQKVSIVIFTNVVCVTQHFCTLTLHCAGFCHFCVIFHNKLLIRCGSISSFNTAYSKTENKALRIPNCNISDRIMALLTCFPWHTAPVHVEPCVSAISMTVIDLLVS